MNGIILWYRKPGWSNWATWKCKDQEEAESVRIQLNLEGYEVQ